jgi:hypothetical protein
LNLFDLLLAAPRRPFAAGFSSLSWFQNYGESEQGTLAAGISLAAHVFYAQKHLESPAMEKYREHLIITNDCFTASFEYMPERIMQDFCREYLNTDRNKTITGRIGNLALGDACHRKL